MNNQKFLVVILGPTAIGKTALAIEVAKGLNTEIVSADSRQFFREISIGTAKPTGEELKAARHHFINSHSIAEDYNVGKFEEDAIALIEKVLDKKNSVVMVGGSGLYIDAVCKGFDKLPKADLKIRKQLTELYSAKGITALQKLLKEKDEEHCKKIDLSNPHRLMRALEVCLITGKPYSALRKGKKQKRHFSSIKIGLNMDREELYARINQRVDDMMKCGLLEEVKSVVEHKEKNALRTVGYKELFGYLEEKTDLQTAVEKIKQNTRNFAKRQLTWFRRDKEIKWFSPNEKEKMMAHIRAEMN